MNVTSFEELSLQITLSLLLGMPGSRGAEWR